MKSDKPIPVPAEAVDALEFLRFSGLYEELYRRRMIAGFTEAESSDGKQIECEPIGFVSHPEEWCFSQLRDAALLTLAIQNYALDHDMTLASAIPANIQFRNGAPIHADPLAFARFKDGEPWKAGREFRERFLYPLALMSYHDATTYRMQKNISREEAKEKLRGIWWKKPSLFFALNRSQEDATTDTETQVTQLHKLAKLIDSLPVPKPAKAQQERGLSDTEQKRRHELVAQFCAWIHPKVTWDMHASAGEFSEPAMAKSQVIAIDSDHRCIEKIYARIRKDDIEEGHEPVRTLPLWIDVSDARSRELLTARGPADLVLALGLAEIPLSERAAFLARAGNHAVVEFAAGNDTKEMFEAAFASCFLMLDAQPIGEGERRLYFFKRKG